MDQQYLQRWHEGHDRLEEIPNPDREVVKEWITMYQYRVGLSVGEGDFPAMMRLGCKLYWQGRIEGTSRDRNAARRILEMERGDGEVGKNF